MMGTSSELNAQENIAVMYFMEDEVLKVADRNNFVGIFTTNTNPLTQVDTARFSANYKNAYLENLCFQQLGTSVYGYEVLLDYQVNQYVYHDGTMPFGAAPDDQRAIVHYKNIESSKITVN